MALIEAEQRRIEADEARMATATRVSLVSIVGNSLLSLLKLLAGIFAHSGAMISDAVHSASDVFSSIIVIVGVRLAAKEADREHPYGHERFEPVSAIVLAAVLLATGLLIGYRAVESIAAGSAERLETPGRLALAAAVLSIVCKEGMFWYTRAHARRIDSGALMAEAWHHRSDALSSLGALVGIAGARLGHPVLDPLASLVICAFIAKAALDIFRDALEKMVDHACSVETEQAIRACAEEQEGVLGVDLLQTRQFGSRAYVDLEIAADGSQTLHEAHEIAQRVHDRVEEAFPDVKHIMVHVNPAD